MHKFILYLATISLLFVSCGDSDDDSQNLEELSFDIETSIKSDRVVLTAVADFEDDLLEYEWSCNDERICLNSNTESVSYLIFPDSENGMEVKVDLKISNEVSSKNLSELIDIPKFNSHSEEWGLGMMNQDRADNDVNYYWYIDQKATGQHSALNCGPTAVSMCLKWEDENFSQTVEYARSQYHSAGGWWYTIDIISYLNDNKVNNWTVNLYSEDVLIDELKNENIIILCLDMHLIRDETDPTKRIDKYYPTEDDWGHFIIVKGFRKVDGITFLEVYDPSSWGEKYNDESYKGINRYYRASDVIRSTDKWWSNAIIVSRNSKKSKNALNVKSIKHAWGR